jgi:hypothetical protein
MKPFFMILTLLLVATVINLNAQPFSGGYGTAIEPYQIKSKVDMEELADSVNNSTVPSPYNWSKGKYFALMNDIIDPVETVVGRRLALSLDPLYSFQGNFNGNGFKITVSINRPTESYLGVFGYCTDSCVIENLNVDGIIIGFSAIGGIVGEISSSSLINSSAAMIKNCNNYAHIKGTLWVGGIAGFSYGKIINCNNHGTIEGHAIGGIAGGIRGSSALASGCINYGFVKGDINTGGIAGASGGSIINCSNFGVVIGNDEVGCIVGKNDSNGQIINCHYDEQMCGEED